MMKKNCMLFQKVFCKSLVYYKHAIPIIYYNGACQLTFDKEIDAVLFNLFQLKITFAW